MLELRPYQENLKNKARKAFLKYKRVILLAPCGAGKTVVASSIMQDSTNKGKKVWFIVHRKELLEQAEKTLERYGISKDNIKIYMVQSLAHKIDKIDEEPDLIILDECFVKGTLVDGIPIENIKKGDYVKSYNHKTKKIENKKVLNIFKKKAKELLKIRLNNGKEIICTPNHPFYTKNGYIEAYKLKKRDELCLLWERNNGRKEQRIIRKVWVESIEIQKPTSDGRFGGVCEDGYVYNIEVEDNNNYFANGILVHNCHHGTSSTYLKILNKFPNAYVLGLTATPARMQGKPLGDVFEAIVSEITAKKLIEMKFLAEYDYYAPQIGLDFSDVKIKKGDYDKEGIDQKMGKVSIYGDIIKNYKKLANGKKTIIYCHSIEYSKTIEELFTKYGYKIKHFDGNTPAKEREQIVEDFREGKIQILTNVDLIGEGFDVPSCECVLLLRPTQSLRIIYTI